MTDANGVSANGSTGAAAAAGSDFDGTWATLFKNPEDFFGWEKAIREAEAFNGGVTKSSPPADIQRLTEVYDAFLGRFPLCFGYWKKFVDWTMQLEGPAAALEVFRSGVSSIHNSVDLWTQYCAFKIEHFPEDEEGIRALFNEGIEKCGYDFLSHEFWDKCIEWEDSKGRGDRVLSLLERAIRIPLHQFNRFFERYTTVAATRPVRELVSSEDFASLEEEVRNPSGPVKTETPSAPKTEEEVEAALRLKIHEMKSAIYMKTQEAVHARWVFESEIKRPYFHVKPLDEGQLANWRKYLDFEESQPDNIHRTFILYERCLVACASYEEFWLRFARYAMANNSDIDTIRNIFARATRIFVPKQRASIRIAHAEFEEEQGNGSQAESVYREFFKTVPDHAEAVTRFAHFLRRQNRVNEIPDAFEAASKGTTEGKTKAYLEVAKAKVMYRITRDVGAAREAFRAAAEQHPETKYAWLTWFLFEIEQQEGDQVDNVEAVWESCKGSLLATEDKAVIGQRYLTFLLETSPTIAEVNKLEVELARDLKVHEGEESRKRGADDGSGSRPSKQARVDGAADPNAAAAASYYGQGAAAAGWNGSYYGAQGYGDAYSAQTQATWDYSQAATAATGTY
ncbi:hypothetical protein HDV00_004044 [Rhizophlyctis rosea]|nr:hypothetical protein HDV00_004044 [Rhizophlyctis rosea]